MDIDKAKLLERFLRYVKIDTQSSDSSDKYPSTDKQLDLLKILKDELVEIGVQKVTLNEHGYVIAKIDSTVKETSNKKIGLIAHVDTSPEVSSKNVNPVVHENYDGNNITLPVDKSQIITTTEFPELLENKGNTIITSDGTTLLGADDKAGIAVIVTAIDYILKNNIPHGDIRIAFTPDEEIGQGTKYFNVKDFDCDYAYTFDSHGLAHYQIETFNAKKAEIEFIGVDSHPGTAKGIMCNSIRAASYFISKLPENKLPETTEKREGFIHSTNITGQVGTTKISLILRDFSQKGLTQKEDILRSLLVETKQHFPKITVKINITDQYKNMREVIDQHPLVIEKLKEAIKKSQLKPVPDIVRGGTDGSHLSGMGLPTPNLSIGAFNFHSKGEWASLEWMAKTVEIVANLVEEWSK